MLVFFALLFPFALSATEQYNKEFSFELRNVTVKDVFRYIEKTASMSFSMLPTKNCRKRLMLI